MMNEVTVERLAPHLIGIAIYLIAFDDLSEPRKLGFAILCGTVTWVIIRVSVFAGE